MDSPVTCLLKRVGYLKSSVANNVQNAEHHEKLAEEYRATAAENGRAITDLIAAIRTLEASS